MLSGLALKVMVQVGPPLDVHTPGPSVLAV